MNKMAKENHSLLGRVSALEAESERQRAWAEGLLQAALREAMGA